eukprot:CAMPEP_0118664592 /NCGR_PEP_ID=MMETSP0785-20121206/18105_1 /TAXON_ID=91992 /ORGANISM="Bolidomonas pacifica, Strain CCMP 1866" /LENGTH=64 /DNA_ID=CAMNT_0006558529 /DNA_START=86 /DNA_END=280 /DNA_ORIENTATION=+
MNVMSPLVRVHSLEVHDVPYDVVLVGYSVAPEHVAALAGDGEGLAAGVALNQAYHLGGCGAGVH